MVTWEVHGKSEMPSRLVEKFPDYEKRPYVLQEFHSLQGIHYVIYTDNPFIMINPVRHVISRKRKWQTF